MLRLQRAGCVTLRLRLPDGIETGDVATWIVPAGAADGDAEGDGLHVVNGAVAYSHVRPGRWSVFATGRGDRSHPLGRIDDVEVVAGKTTDAGLLDLRPVLATARIRVLDGDGTPALDAAVWWRPSRNAAVAAAPFEGWSPRSVGADGTVRVPVATPIDVMARCAGTPCRAQKRYISCLPSTHNSARRLPVG